MSDSEIIDVIHQRIRRLGLRIDRDAIWDCVFLSKGLPYYAHLIGLHASQACCDDRKATITRNTIKQAQQRAIIDSNVSIRTSFEQAVFSERRDNIFLPVLVSCALARKDPSGKFLAKDVATILSDIAGQRYDVPAFAYHLDQFASAERGQMLEKLGVSRPFRFRFKEALCEPYIILKGIEAGVISEQMQKKHGPKRQHDLFPAI